MGQSTNNSPASTNILEKWFHLSEQGTTIKRELLAGLTTFVSMAYILFVNPSVLGMAGMNKGAVFTATALSAIIGCLLMAFLANYPIAIAPGLVITRSLHTRWFWQWGSHGRLRWLVFL